MAMQTIQTGEFLTTTERFQSLLSMLGIESAHFVVGSPMDAAAIAHLDPARISALTLFDWHHLDVEDLRPFGKRLTLIGTDREPATSRANALVSAVGGARRVTLPGYEWYIWSDLAADRGDAIVRALVESITSRNGSDGKQTYSIERTSEIAGIRCHANGSGPALVLAPLGLAPSQWAPIAGRLAEHFCVIQVGGLFVGATAMLETRAASPGHRRFLERFVDSLRVAAGDDVLEIGCGSAAPARLLARRTGAGRIIAADPNAFLLEEARARVAQEGLDAKIDIVEANAEALPFANDLFDVAYSVTAFEECDADRAIAELVRVSRPGGRVGVAVRGTDMPKVVNVAGSPELMRAFINMPGAGHAPGGCGDISLYRRMADAGLQELEMSPELVPADCRSLEWLREISGSLKDQLPADLRDEYGGASDAAWERGTFLVALPYHCCVGVKPG
jgi:SAM-dependent methyltransferase